MTTRSFLIGFVLATTWCTTAGATPLALSYTVGPSLVPGAYEYNFTLTLDNNDGTWVAGQQWDWIIFGDNDSADTKNGFDVNGGLAAGGTNWNTTSISGPISNVTVSLGAHNGPTLAMATNNVSLPGWLPTAVGQSVIWSGTSTVFIPNGELYWSALVVGGGATAVSFELAEQVAVSDPASTVSLLGLGLAGLGALRLRRRQ